MRVRVRDLRLYFDVVGIGLVPDGPTMRERPVIVCLHGGPAFDHTPFKPLLVPLADVAQLVFLDQRACGRSDDCDPRLWTLDTWIEDVPAFCEALELTRPILLGQSFGGFVALGVAARYPELAAKLIVSSSAGRLRPDRALAMFERLGGPAARDVAAQWFEHPEADSSEAYRRTCLPLYNPTPGDPDVMARAQFRPEVGIRFWRDELPKLDLFPELGRISCPTLILAGELDPLTTVRDHEELAGAITGSRLEVFAAAGHGVYRDKPSQALATIRSFLLDDSAAQPRGEAARATRDS